MKSITASILISALLVLSSAPFAVSAFATTCSAASIPSGDVCTFSSSSNNIGLSGVTMYVKVDNTGTHTVITVSVDTGSSGLTVHSIDEFGYGNSTHVSSVGCTPLNCNTNWDLSKQGSKNLDGYGSFLNAIMLSKGSKNDTADSFTLSSLVTSFGLSSEGIPSYFSAHVLLNGTVKGCDDSKPDFSPSGGDDNNNCTNPTGFWGGSILVAPEFPMGTLVGVLTPIAAIGAFFGLKRFVLVQHTNRL